MAVGGLGIAVVNCKNVNDFRTGLVRTGPRMRIRKVFSVSRDQRRTNRTSKCDTCTDLRRTLGSTYTSAVLVTAPGSIRGRVTIRTLRTKGRIVYRGPIALGDRRLSRVVRATGRRRHIFVIRRGHH